MEREEFKKLCAKGNQVIENIDGCKMLIENIEYLLAEKEDISNTMMYVNIGQGTTRVPLTKDVVITALQSTLEIVKSDLHMYETQLDEL